MDPTFLRFARKYRNLLRLIDIIEELRKFSVLDSFSTWIEAKSMIQLTPYSLYREAITSSVLEVFPNINPDDFWKKWVINHSLSILDFYRYENMSLDWVISSVNIINDQLIEELRETGGLVLTYHFHHQNTLCCALGLLGIKVSAIAASPSESKLDSYIGKWARKLNEKTERHFRGGRYLYTDNLREIVRDVPRILTDGHVVVCLLDNNHSGQFPQIQKLFQRQIRVPRGIVEIALRHRAPVYVCALIPNQGRVQASRPIGVADSDKSLSGSGCIDLPDSMSLLLDICTSRRNGFFCNKRSCSISKQTALLANQAISYDLSGKRLDSLIGDSVSNMLQAYFDYLEYLLTHQPYIWQGWQWIGALQSCSESDRRQEGSH